MKEINELMMLMAERRVMYQFLARVFRAEADRELIGEVRQMDFSDNDVVQEIDLGFKLLAQFVNQEVSESLLVELAAEYARIFLGAGAIQTGIAFPYESVYTSPRGLLMQAARDQVVELYRQEGIQRSAQFHWSEDHIALELEFAAHLCEKTRRALKEGNTESVAYYLEMQFNFFDKHLCAWTPRFFADMLQAATTDFYKALALIAGGYLSIDRNLVTDLLEMVKSEVILSV